ncbi:alpha/beta hydrolase [Radiobacillus sp. PE A8.2]|uniref:alpha/beta hydrolase n=1 Tax=Radiobacillus sp. PE A8.2 TaxID=3380349 RepID=UPI00389094B1
MALIRCEFFSEVLMLSTSMTVVLPQSTFNQSARDKHPTLFLLHGYSDDDSMWLRHTSIERYAEDYGLAVVMPKVDHSFYTDMKYGNKYWTFLTEELPVIARSFFSLSEKREDNFVAGLSMGGYGAFKWALHFPEKFAAAVSLSGALDMVTRVNDVRAEAENDNPWSIKKPLSLVFGDQDISGSGYDLIAMLRLFTQSNKQKPLLYQACGTEDFLYEGNINFKNACSETSFILTTDFGPGDHSWKYWDSKIKDVLAWLPIK